MKCKELEVAVNNTIDDECMQVAKSLLMESKRELMAAELVVKKLKAKHEKLLDMDVEEFIFLDSVELPRPILEFPPWILLQTYPQWARITRASLGFPSNDL